MTTVHRQINHLYLEYIWKIMIPFHFIEATLSLNLEKSLATGKDIGQSKRYELLANHDRLKTAASIIYK